MMVKATRAFWYRDTKRGCMCEAKRGDAFEVAEDEDREQLIQILQSGKGFVCDENFLPEKAQYKVLASYSERRPDGSTLMLGKDQFVELNQELATRLCLQGYVCRERPEEWNPRHLIGGAPPKTGMPKKMYDEESPIEPFATRPVRKSPM